MPQTITAPVTFNISPAGTLARLQPSDVTYLGMYHLTNASIGAQVDYAYGFTHRYVGSQLRFLFGRYNTGGIVDICEANAPAAFGSSITSTTNVWPHASVWPTTDPQFRVDHWGMRWEDQSGGTGGPGRLWAAGGIDYPNSAAGEDNYTGAISVRNLGAAGSVTNKKGLYGFSGVQQRRVMGGACPVPAWFQSQYGNYPYCYGFGSYASRGGAGPVSMGLEMVFGPDLSTLAAPNYAVSGIEAVSHQSGWAPPPWYPGHTAPTTYDRSRRNGNVTNQLDAWTSPVPGDPNGWGSWCWADGYWDAFNWVTGATKHAILPVATCMSGNLQYINSSIVSQSRSADFHFYDPAVIGQALQGAIPPWAVQPYAMRSITAEIQAAGGLGGGSNWEYGGASGASWDLQASRVYVLSSGIGVFAYQIAA